MVEHVTRPEESVADVARIYNISPAELRAANGDVREVPGSDSTPFGRAVRLWIPQVRPAIGAREAETRLEQDLRVAEAKDSLDLFARRFTRKGGCVVARAV